MKSSFQKRNLERASQKTGGKDDVPPDLVGGRGPPALTQLWAALPTWAAPPSTGAGAWMRLLSRELGKMLSPHFLSAAQTSSSDRGPDLPAGAAGENSVLREAEIGGEGGALPKTRLKRLLFPAPEEFSVHHFSSYNLSLNFGMSNSAEYNVFA